MKLILEKHDGSTEIIDLYGYRFVRIDGEKMIAGGFGHKPESSNILEEFHLHFYDEGDFTDDKKDWFTHAPELQVYLGKTKEEVLGNIDNLCLTMDTVKELIETNKLKILWNDITFWARQVIYRIKDKIRGGGA